MICGAGDRSFETFAGDGDCELVAVDALRPRPQNQLAIPDELRWPVCSAFGITAAWVAFRAARADVFDFTTFDDLATGGLAVSALSVKGVERVLMGLASTRPGTATWLSVTEGETGDERLGMPVPRDSVEAEFWESDLGRR